MKNFLIIILIGIGLLSCGLQQKTSLQNRNPDVQIKSEEADSTEYEIIVIDPGFESWFITNRKPVWYYEQSYLETWNLRYVSAWNEKVMSRRYQQAYPDNPFDERIDYRPQINYGLDLNYKLFHYFKFIEETWGRIL